MDYAFTTLGCQEWDLTTIIDRASEYGFGGVDFRGYLGELELFELPEFTTEVDRTVRRFGDAGLDVPCFSSSVRLMSRQPEQRRAAEDEIRAYAELCERFGARFIRVFGGGVGQTPRDEAIDMAAENLLRFSELARPHGATVLLETHDDWVRREHLLPLMQRGQAGGAGLLWDTHHTYRPGGESPADFWQALGPYVRYSHWKDSRVAPSAPRGHELCLVGAGDIPLEQTLRCMVKGGYRGYLALEWEKKWHPELDRPEVAFPAFVSHMNRLMKQVGAS